MRSLVEAKCDSPPKTMPTISLVVKGLGAVPSFKNKKRICKKRLITRPEIQEWMERCTRSLQSQFASYFQTIAEETLMDAAQQCLIALSKHSGQFDDCWQWIPKETLTAEKCDKGQEGCEIIIEML